MVKNVPWACLAFVVGLQTPPAGNLLVNGDASQGTKGWTPGGVARVERIGGVSCFTIRVGSFHQDVRVDQAIGMFAAVVAKGQAERVNGDGSITGLPYLYGTVSTADRRHFLAYWQGQKMLGRPEQSGQWVPMSGVFSVPYGAAYVSIQLMQAERKGSPQDGSAARFTDVQMQLFPTEEAAREFVARYK
jgi:hypothetical protein